MIYNCVLKSSRLKKGILFVAIATIGLVNFAYADEVVTTKSVSIKSLPTAPIELTQNSELVQNS